MLYCGILTVLLVGLLTAAAIKSENRIGSQDGRERPDNEKGAGVGRFDRETVWEAIAEIIPRGSLYWICAGVLGKFFLAPALLDLVESKDPKFQDLKLFWMVVEYCSDITLISTGVLFLCCILRVFIFYWKKGRTD